VESDRTQEYRDALLRKGSFMFTQNAPLAESRLGPGDTFFFACHPGLDCFNTCCRNKHLPLTPYDVLRLKSGLGMHSDEFLSEYTLYRLDPKSGFPLVSLRMKEAPGSPCPFVTAQGCRVYADRPTACRLYPLGRAVGQGPEATEGEAFYFRLDTPGCLGTSETGVWRVEDWERSQGLEPYLRMNDRMLNIVYHPARDRREPLSEQQIQKVIVAWYNLDIFRELVSTPRFLEIHSLDEGTRERVVHDDLALLELGTAYLHKALFPGTRN
jgi:hypothetical protein